MNITIRNNSLEIEGYVNAVERDSKPLASRIGQFIEKIKKGAFKRSLERNPKVYLLLNHDWNRELGNTEDNVELYEDNIGLKVRATITDPDVIKDAQNDNLVGWSFGFTDVDVDNKRNEEGITLREVNDLDLKEVSLLNREKSPAYEGTLVEIREEQTIYRAEPNTEPIQLKVVKNKPIDYSKYDKMLAEIKED